MTFHETMTEDTKVDTEEQEESALDCGSVRGGGVAADSGDDPMEVVAAAAVLSGPVLRSEEDVHESCDVVTIETLALLAAQEDIREWVTTDTIPRPAERTLPNLVSLSVAPLIGEAIRRIHHGESVSSLFAAPDWMAG